MRLPLIITMIAIAACSNRGMYEALRQNECFKNEHIIHCEDGRDYDEYMREREKLLKDDDAKKNDEKSAKAQKDLPNLFH